MYINFQQYQINRSLTTVHTNVVAKITSCINLQLPIIVNFYKSTLSDMYHRKTYMHINFQVVVVVVVVVVDQSKPCTQIYLQFFFFNLQLAIRISKITPFGGALPPNGHSGRLDVRLPRKEIIYTNGRTDGQTLMGELAKC